MDIYNYFRQVNPDITPGMNTDGAIQSTFFWHALGKPFNKPSNYFVFSINGLDNTNSVFNNRWQQEIDLDV